MSTISGSFDINLIPQEDGEFPVGRLSISKKYQGDMEGAGIGQMISKRLENGTAVYFAIEEFSGSVNGRNGSFTLLHNGFMDSDKQTLDVQILAGSGAGELQGISGSMGIRIDDDGHHYDLSYQL